jgi:hypothetical protein
MERIQGCANFNPNDYNAGDLTECIQYRTRCIVANSIQTTECAERDGTSCCEAAAWAPGVEGSPGTDMSIGDETLPGTGGVAADGVPTCACEGHYSCLD